MTPPSPLAPLPDRDWTPMLAAHLLNRAGFGGPPAEIAALHAKGLAGAVAGLVDYAAIPDPFPDPAFAADGPHPPPDRRALAGLSDQAFQQKQRQFTQANRRQIDELRGWWLERMRTTPRPLQEKLTLFWHGHFATGFTKVRLAYAMYRQNRMLRAQANGSWPELLIAVSQDPAMLIYLDGARNSRRSPNENYARELLELFTLGIGHYTEDDIREAARAFTGWTFDRETQQFVNRPGLHDGGVKTFLGERGRFDGTDILRILVRHEASAPYICGRLWSFFAYDEPGPELVGALAEVFRAAGYRFQPLLAAMFRSREFYSDRAVRTQIKSPVQWLVSSVRCLEAPLPPPALSLHMLETLGQELFDPPNVAGWEGGQAWITTASLLQRYNFASVLTEGGGQLQEALGGEVDRVARRIPPPGGGAWNDLPPPTRRQLIGQRRRELAIPVLDPARALPAGHRHGPQAACDHLQWRLYQSPLRPADREAFRAFFTALGEPASWTDDRIRQAIHALMSTPQFQLT